MQNIQEYEEQGGYMMRKTKTSRICQEHGPMQADLVMINEVLDYKT
jgi:hypothetical protein